MTPPQTETCPGCKNEIDPDMCWCGSNRKDYCRMDGHSFVPMGCDCGRVIDLGPKENHAEK